jgi:hypothetical protein
MWTDCILIPGDDADHPYFFIVAYPGTAVFHRKAFPPNHPLHLEGCLMISPLWSFSPVNL